MVGGTEHYQPSTISPHKLTHTQQFLIKRWNNNPLSPHFRWAEVLSLASRAELPPGYLAGSQGSLVADNTSTSSTEYENG